MDLFDSSNRRNFMKVAASGVVTALAGNTLGAPEPRRRPNIIFIMVDDLGKEWINCYGSRENLTPNVDKLAATGMKFENAYSMPQCTPTRACLLTGQYPFRNGWINHWDVPRWGVGYFDWKRNPSFGRMLRDAGYATCAAGKWQINDFRLTPDALPKHGFEEYFMWTGGETGVPHSGRRYWDPYIHSKKGSRSYGKDSYGPDLFTDFVIDFMRRHRDEPMMVYYPMVLTHGPYTPTPHQPDVQGKQDTYRAMVRYTDYLLGRILKTVNELGIREDTIIIWTTDNGSPGNVHAYLKGRKVRGGKTKTTENGICEPFIVNCPSRVPSGVTTDALMDFSDMLPTFAELAGTSLPTGYEFDGHSIAPLILGDSEESRREWIMAMGGRKGALDSDGDVANRSDYRDRVLRDKRYKLYLERETGKAIKLVDLKKDPAEQNNLINNPECDAIRQRLESYAESFPAKDGVPLYRSRAANPWDKKPQGKWLWTGD